MDYNPYDFLLATIDSYASVIGASALLFFAGTVAGQYMIFQKSGEPGWKAFIPVYNQYTLYKLVNCTNLFVISLVCGIAMLFPPLPIFSSFPLLLGLACLIFHILFSISLSKAFGQDEGFFIGLLFLYPVFLMILGFSSCRYVNRYAYQHYYNDPWQNDYHPHSRSFHEAPSNLPPPNARGVYAKAPVSPAPQAYHDVRSIPQQQGAEKPEVPCFLFGEKGAMHGKNIRLHGKMVLGTQPDKCTIRYPKGTPGVSRKHCTIRYRNGIVTVTDEYSTYGTWINSHKLTPGIAFKLNRGHRLSIGSKKETLILRDSQ